METSIQRWTCNQCNVSEDSTGEIRFGGGPDFLNWLTVTRFCKPAHSFSFQRETLHFCGPTCLQKFFAEKA